MLHIYHILEPDSCFAGLQQLADIFGYNLGKKVKLG